MISSPSSSSTTGSERSTELAECGWRTVAVTQPDGTTTQNMVLLTPEE